MDGATRRLVVVGMLAAAVCITPASANMVLLDEYWSPEISHNGTEVTEVDTEETRDPTEAVAGYFSARLENERGAPNVRCRNGPTFRIEDLVPGETEARMWYRTDNFNGNLRLEVWIHTPEAGRPFRFLGADLDGGGEDGRLVTDDRWHRAEGILQKADEYDMAPESGVAGTSWVWLRATEGWDIAHRTFVDRIEAVPLSESESAGSLPARHVRPVPGRHTEGPGFVWWEAEDALEPPEPARDNFAPTDAAQQHLVSNGRWVLMAKKTNLGPLRYEVEVDEAGTYALWARGYYKQGSFRWRWDGGEWRTSAPGVNTARAVIFISDWMPVGWAHLGEVELSADTHTFEVEGLQAPVGLGFDCWVLARNAFVSTEKTVGTNTPSQKE